jgi:hypothetical protein
MQPSTRYCGCDTLLPDPDLRIAALHSSLDRSPSKRGKCTSGTDIPTLVSKHMDEGGASYSFLLARNQRTVTARQGAPVSQWCHRFVVPIPAGRVL